MVAMEIASDGEGTKFDIVADGMAKKKKLGLTKKKESTLGIIYDWG